MHAVEFEIDAENDIIRIPEKYNMLYSKHLRLVAMYDDNSKGIKQRSHEQLADLLGRPGYDLPDNYTLSRDEIHER